MQGLRAHTVTQIIRKRWVQGVVLFCMVYGSGLVVSALSFRVSGLRVGLEGLGLLGTDPGENFRIVAGTTSQKTSLQP